MKGTGGDGGTHPNVDAPNGDGSSGDDGGGGSDAGTGSDGGTGPDGDIVVPDANPGDMVAPTISSVSPANAAGSVWLHDRFAVTFSEPIAAMTVTTSSLRLLDPSNQNISGTVWVSADARTAYVRALDTATMIGQLRLEVGTSITDLAGNAFAGDTLAWTLAPWAKPPTGLSVGASPQPPVVGAASDATVWTATSIAGATGRQIVVTDASGAAVGAALGTNAVTPVLAGDTVAWAEATSQTIAAARWDGSQWVALPSPGAGAMPALAMSPNGVVGIAWVDAANDLEAARLVNGTWTSLGTPLAATQVLSEPSVAMPADSTLVVAFVDRAAGVDKVRVAPFGSAERAPLTMYTMAPAGRPTRVSVAATASVVAVAWDEFSGFSFSAHAAVSNGNDWTVLPALDIDPPADSRAPAIELDAANAPVVAWTERVEGAYRGFVARWGGAAWAPVGGTAWTGTPLAVPSRASLRLWRGVVPTVAWMTEGATTIELARFNGPSVAPLGIPSRSSLSGCSFDAANPPATLLATGCFVIVAGVATPHPGLVPYDLNSELWSDGALKRRWLGVPTGTLTQTGNGSLDAPVGSFVIKEFAIDDPATRTIMETRFLVRTASGWQGFGYRWRVNGSDADLLPGNTSLTITWPLASGGTHDHIYPSRAQCRRCHDASTGPLLGVRAEQLARKFDYAGVLDDQLRVLAAIGVFSAGVVTAQPAPHDPRRPLDQRVRSYLASNCAHCHNPAGERPQQDFRLATPLAATGLCDLVTPGDPNASRLFQRDTSRPGMPPIATDIVDPLVSDIEFGWIQSMTSCP